MNKINPALIGFDIDGVVADTGGAFIRIANEEYGINSISLDDITSFEVIDCLDVDQGIIEEIFIRLLDDPLTAGLQPMEDAIPVLHRFADEAPLTFITARPHEKPIARWLKHYLQPATFEKIRLVAMGVHDNKTAYIKDLGLKYFVDDRLQTCKMLANEGITPLVYNQPWNKNGHDLPTVNDWQAIHSLCFD
ncbi:MAG: hypothetical protein OES28_06700 [Desulfobulbaceae bacterium]|jgi:uncharacterized HAD superfamily protein|nr:hypothetical protein [Desulfobulbaceae bacterium]MDH3574010.1 hypothetical protein [Desulfobacteraceae bacterium]HKJ13435.1 hypothetical protein [Desulfobulbales bacterium]MDH3776491.1 hypothetical protein [Desulfobulbaceae bacterium]MDH3781718.1 hypothetical protein [Desulfobulbaceae bacterium]